MNPRIFVSCVTKEFGATRQRVANILSRLGYEPVWQDIFGTEPGDLRQVLRDKIDGCDGLLQIVGHGYGFEPPAADAEFGRTSYTQFEFLYAQRRQKKTWLLFPDHGCTRDVPLDQLDRPRDPQHPDPGVWQAERQQLQKDYRQQLAGTSHLINEPSTDAELDLAVERLRDEFAELRRGFRRWQWAVLGAVVLVLVSIVLLLNKVNISSTENTRAFRALNAKLEEAQKRDAPGSELLAEFQRRLDAARFSTQKADPDQRAAGVLSELARDKKMTVDALRQLILQAAAGARERLELAVRLRRAAESEAVRLRQIERDANKDLAVAAMAEYQFEKALEYYQRAIELTSRTTEGPEWSALQNSLGICHRELGIRVAGAPANQHLRSSVSAYREALKVRTREQLPQDWAATQNNLGVALESQADRSEGAEAVRLLGEAVSAYREALKVRTREQSPQGWAMTQNNLGNSLRHQADQSEGADAVRLLGEAVSAYREALKVRTREQFPQGWARTQNNLGNALSGQAGRSEGAEAVRLLGEAVSAYREALKVRTREQFPQDWAMTQYNLGNSLSDQASRSEGADAVHLLGEAISAYCEALKVRTREQFPQDWAMTQYNLGLTLSAEAGRSEGAEAVRLLDEAVSAYRKSLQIYTTNDFPRQHGKVAQSLQQAEAQLMVFKK